MASPTALATAYCYVHGKLSYDKRSKAKQVARGHADHKSVYRCDPNANPVMWHVGGLSQAVLHGEKTRDEFYGSAS
jgi:hypothetical protein